VLNKQLNQGSERFAKLMLTIGQSFGGKWVSAKGWCSAYVKKA
jgi:hypothetical protein